MFTHILTSLCDVFDDLKNVYVTFCKIEHFISVSSFMLKISLFFWTFPYKTWNISLPVRKGKSFTVTGSPIYISAHDDTCRLCLLAAFCFGYWLMPGPEPATLSMTTLCSNFACSSLYFQLLVTYCQSFMHIVRILHILPCHFLNLICNILQT